MSAILGIASSSTGSFITQKDLAMDEIKKTSLVEQAAPDTASLPISIDSVSEIKTQQLQILPYCLNEALGLELLHNSNLPLKINKERDPLPASNFMTTSFALLKKLNIALVNEDESAYNLALKKQDLFCLGIFFFGYLTGCGVRYDYNSTTCGKMFKKGIIVKKESFEDPFFLLLPPDIQEMFHKIFFDIDSLTASHIVQLLQKFVPLSPVTPKIVHDVSRYKRFGEKSENEIIFFKHNTSLPVSSKTMDELTVLALNTLATCPFERKIWIHELTPTLNLFAVNVRKGLKITTQIYAMTSPPKRGGWSEVHFGIKLSTGKWIALKSDKIGTQFVINEVAKTRQIHAKVEENKAELRKEYPEAFSEDPKGPKIIVIQSNPHTYVLEPHQMITDKCDSDSRGVCIYFNDKIQKFSRNYTTLSNDILTFTRRIAKQLTELERNLEEDKLSYSDYLMRKQYYKIQLETVNNKLFIAGKELYLMRADEISLHKEILQKRQKKIMGLCLYEIIALAILHELSFTHSDLKPENILITNTSSDRPKAVFCDLYSAQQLHSYIKNPFIFANKNPPGLSQGTETYISEKAINATTVALLAEDNYAYHIAVKGSDNFALGAILYFRLTGIELPRYFQTVLNHQNNYTVCVKPHPDAYRDTAFLLLPPEIRTVLCKLISNDDSITLKEVANLFRKYKE
ncbi:MAG: hypothetical protein WC222_00820 [Parachlamydiales bacterium]|jgi:serine/threonine protein kinase